MMRLSDFRVLSFDCYGTLIDWETGLAAALAPLAGRAGRAVDVLGDFGAAEVAVQAAFPALAYTGVLEAVHALLAARWGVAADAAAARAFGHGVGRWPAFADTVAALRYLKTRYRLVVLSNVDRARFAQTLPRLGVAFGAIYTAEEIGGYKPDPRNFAYLIAREAAAGYARGEILHVAQSLFHDHAPARAAGLASAWIERGAGRLGATAPGARALAPSVTFADLAALAAAVKAEGSAPA